MEPIKDLRLDYLAFERGIPSEDTRDSEETLMWSRADHGHGFLGPWETLTLLNNFVIYAGVGAHPPQVCYGKKLAMLRGTVQRNISFGRADNVTITRLPVEARPKMDIMGPAIYTGENDIFPGYTTPPTGLNDSVWVVNMRIYTDGRVEIEYGGSTSILSSVNKCLFSSFLYGLD